MSTLTFVSNYQSVSRWVLVGPLAALLTLSLLVAMERLIASNMEAPIDEPSKQITPVVIKEKPKVNEVREKPILVETNELPPPMDQIVETFNDPTVTGLGPLTLLPPVTTTPTEIDFSTGGQLVKQVMVPPVYPRRPLSQGIEGFVDVRFSVTPKGTTTDISVVRSNPEGTFDRAATKAVAKWRYRPPASDGITANSEPFVERISFRIEN